MHDKSKPSQIAWYPRELFLGTRLLRHEVSWRKWMSESVQLKTHSNSFHPLYNARAIEYCKNELQFQTTRSNKTRAIKGEDILQTPCEQEKDEENRMDLLTAKDHLRSSSSCSSNHSETWWTLSRVRAVELGIKRTERAEQKDENMVENWSECGYCAERFGKRVQVVVVKNQARRGDL